MKSFLRASAIFLIVFPDPTFITDVLGGLLLMASLTMEAGDQQYRGTCGCDFHRSGGRIRGLWATLMYESRNIKLLPVRQGTSYRLVPGQTERRWAAR